MEEESGRGFSGEGSQEQVPVEAESRKGRVTIFGEGSWWKE